MVSTMTFIRAQDNLSDGPVQPFGTGNPSPISIPGINEIFRFLPGLVTQGTSFGFADKWFALGELDFGQSFYGIRFQLNRRALTMGYTDATPNKPRIQWIHNGLETADYLEFRVGNGFGGSGGPGINTLVASMSPFAANTYFGTDIDVLNPFGDNSTTSPKVGIATDGQLGLSIINTGGLSLDPTIGAKIKVNHDVEFGYGLFSECSGAENSIGVMGSAAATGFEMGVMGLTQASAFFSAAIYGDAGSLTGNNYAGYFDGEVFSTVNFTTSDEKLKNNINDEKSALEKIALLRPVTYDFKETSDINLPTSNQHGFISQEMAEVFPELTKDITKPVLDEDGKIVSELSFKGINYTGLISVLTAGIQELNTELVEEIAAVREELDEYKANDKIRESLVQDSREVSDYSMEQNIPNPFNPT
jgi:hypothetical protein